MPKFRKKPVVVEAIQISRPMTIETPEGTMKGEPGDWLITGVEGEQYFCKDRIFRQTYEPVEQEEDNQQKPPHPREAETPEQQIEEFRG